MSRRPPSQRDPEYAPQRINRALVQRVPGTGKVTNASPTSGRGVAERALLRGGAGAGPASTSAVRFTRDRFALTGDGAQIKTLTYLPAAGSVHVYLNGVEQDEGTDYTLNGAALDVLAPMGALAADVLDVRYAYLTGTPQSVLAVDDWYDDFHREDGPLGTMPTGDAWHPHGTWSILDGQARCENTSGGRTALADYGAADGAWQLEVSNLQVDVALCFRFDLAGTTGLFWQLNKISGSWYAKLVRTDLGGDVVLNGGGFGTPVPGVVDGGSYTLKVTAAGGNVQGYLDGSLVVGAVVGAPYTALTYVGMRIATGELSSRFDNITSVP